MPSEIASIFATLTPGAYGIWTLVLMVGMFLAREYRETRKLSSEDRLARREGYAKQVESLQIENRALREDQRRDREEYDRYRHLCQQETQDLRRDVIRLEGEISGYKRRLDTQGAELAKLKGSTP